MWQKGQLPRGVHLDPFKSSHFKVTKRSSWVDVLLVLVLCSFAVASASWAIACASASWCTDAASCTASLQFCSWPLAEKADVPHISPPTSLPPRTTFFTHFPRHFYCHIFMAAWPRLMHGPWMCPLTASHPQILSSTKLEKVDNFQSTPPAGVHKLKFSLSACLSVHQCCSTSSLQLFQWRQDHVKPHIAGKRKTKGRKEFKIVTSVSHFWLAMFTSFEENYSSRFCILQ